MNGQVFVSYRRADTRGYAHAIYNMLTMYLPEEQVFMDVDTIRPGDDFVSTLETAVSSCNVLLALIGPRWLTVTDDKGIRRIDNSNDFVRIEIATALRRKIPVIPLLVDGAKMPSANDLPKNLKGLARKQAFEIGDRLRPTIQQLLIELAVIFRDQGVDEEKINRYVPTVGDEFHLDSIGVITGEKRNEDEANLNIWLQKLNMTLIPSGEILLGSDNPDAQPFEKPVHKINVGEFFLSKYPITNKVYQEYILVNHDQTVPSASPTWASARPFAWDLEKRTFPRAKEDHPVVLVSWYDALRFCEWLRKVSGLNFRLPSEAEWEKAAKGPENFLYPWGNQWDMNNCNVESVMEGTTVVGNYSPRGDSPYGISDMAGNVWEWCSSLYKPYPYSFEDGRENIELPGKRILRGGSWIYSRKDCRCATRNPLHEPSEVGVDGGFRIALSL